MLKPTITNVIYLTNCFHRFTITTILTRGNILINDTINVGRGSVTQAAICHKSVLIKPGLPWKKRSKQK